MPHYQAPDPGEVDELHLPTQPDCTVVMKRRATRGDVFDAEEAHLNLRERQALNGQSGGGSRIVGFYQCLTLCLIIRWDLEDENGSTWPADDIHSLRRLDPIDGVYLENEARRRTEGMPGGPFANGSRPPFSDSEAATTSESAASSSSTTSPGPSDGLPTSSDASARRTSRRSSSSVNTP